MIISNKHVLILLALSLIPFFSQSQGKVLMVGGGAEGAWSDPAYSWGINSAANKKVGIVSYKNTESQALPNYFLDLGADTAVNIGISNRALANTDSIYNVLMAYDFLFFKGGDQANYYETYQGTKVTQAIMDKFNEGGVIGGTSAGMAILSGVMYTALKGSSYPNDALTNFNHSDITLSNDFINILPSYICDTHFIERGRPFRLWAFMARWYADHDEILSGIGVDDRTAFCIEENKKGIVIGTGAVSIYHPNSIKLKSNQFQFDSLITTHLLDSHRYDLGTKKLLSDFQKDTKAKTKSEDGNYGVLLSGGESIVQQSAMLQYLISEVGNENDTIIVVSQTQAQAQVMINQITTTNKNAFGLSLITNSSYNHADSAHIRNIIRRSKKILFYENSDNSFFKFLEAGETGELLKNHLTRNNITSAFSGQDARYAGAFFTANHNTDALASYRNNLKYEAGLGLLKTTIVMPNTLPQSTKFYENTTSGITYGMIAYQLQYGLYLNAGQFLSIVPRGDSVIMTQHGAYPIVIASNSSKKGDLSSGRNVIAADKLNYQILLNEDEMILGVPTASEDLNYIFEEAEEIIVVKPLGTSIQNEINIFPNPARNVINLPFDETVNYEIVDLTGKTILKGLAHKTIDLSNLPRGWYFLEVISSKTKYYSKFIKE